MKIWEKKIIGSNKPAEGLSKDGLKNSLEIYWEAISLGAFKMYRVIEL